MKITDIILLIDNQKGREHNRLLAKGDFEKGYPMFAGVSLQRARVRWAEAYGRANISCYAKYCGGLEELKNFLRGAYNDGKNYGLDIEGSSQECLAALAEHNVSTFGFPKGPAYHYTEMEHAFAEQETLHNFNGSDYRVMELYGGGNMLLMNVSSGLFSVACDVKMFKRCPSQAKDPEASAEYGIEWGHGVYLSAKPSEVDFKALKEQYAK